MRLQRMTLTTGALLAGLFCAGAGEPGKLPFTISKETTDITKPLRADGSPDYIGAINQIHGAGMTPENNGYVLFLRIVGTGDGQISPRARDMFLKMLGRDAVPADVTVWETYDAFIHSRIGDDPDGKIRDAYDLLRKGPWKAESLPMAAEYLAKEARLLDLAVDVAARPKWWVPYVGAGEKPSMISVLLPSLGSLRDVSNALCTRATLRAGSDDFAGFLLDVIAAKRIGQHVAGGATLIEQLVGVAINSLADTTIGGVAGSGMLSAAQCQEMRAALAEVPRLPTFEISINQGERWMQLDTAERIATGAAPEILSANDISLLKYVEPGQVDWDMVLKDVNQRMDRVVENMKEPSVKIMHERGVAMDEEVAQWKKDMGEGITWMAMKKQAAETREAYSERVARIYMTEMFPSLGRAEELRRRSLLDDEMVQAVLSAAEYKAKNGAWPEKLEALTPGLLPTVPRDIYGDGLVKYVRTREGILVYSVGPNEKDDGGRRNGPTKADDEAIGVRLPPIEALP